MPKAPFGPIRFVGGKAHNEHRCVEWLTTQQILFTSPITMNAGTVTIGGETVAAVKHAEVLCIHRYVLRPMRIKGGGVGFEYHLDGWDSTRDFPASMPAADPIGNACCSAISLIGMWQYGQRRGFFPPLQHRQE